MTIIRMVAYLSGVVLTAVAFAAFAADLVVVASTSDSYKPGQIVKSGIAIKVVEGAKVTLVSESGKKITLIGPHFGPSGIDDEGASGDINLIKSLHKLLTPVGKETSGIGVMRATAVNPWVIDIGRPGDQCIPANGPATFWRPESRKDETLSLNNLADNTEAVTNWPAGTNTLNWPPNVTLSDGVRYRLRLKGSQSPTEFVAHLVPGNFATDWHKVAWMEKMGCVNQAKLLLARLH